MFGKLFGKSSGDSKSTRYRQQSGRYGKPGQFRHKRGNDTAGRGKDGRYK